MALDRSELINLVQLAMKKVNIVPYKERETVFDTNTKRIELTNAAIVCECFINIPDADHTCHVGFTALLNTSAEIKLWLCIDGLDRVKVFVFNDRTVNFTDFTALSVGLHHIAVKASAESPVYINPREAKLGVFL